MPICDVALCRRPHRRLATSGVEVQHSILVANVMKRRDATYIPATHYLKYLNRVRRCLAKQILLAGCCMDLIGRLHNIICTQLVPPLWRCTHTRENYFMNEIQMVGNEKCIWCRRSHWHRNVQIEKLFQIIFIANWLVNCFSFASVSPGSWLGVCVVSPAREPLQDLTIWELDKWLFESTWEASAVHKFWSEWCFNLPGYFRD